MARNRPGQRSRIAGRGRIRVRVDAYAVIAAFLLGIGPGAVVQPCPKHQAAHGDEQGPPAAALHGTHADHGHADHGHADHGHADHGHADHGHADHGQAGSAHAEGSGAGPAHPHSDGPCDCLGLCLTCTGPAQVASAARATQPTSESRTPHGERLDSRPLPDPTAYLRPFAQPPPA
ncbi:MAG: hypothetical protein F4X22_04870 [Gemmatimonadales bacterium]|nr:hypothetical protein [Candidatus Palauibacter denitrificans]